MPYIIEHDCAGMHNNTKGRQIFDLCVWLYGHQSILFGSTIRSHVMIIAMPRDLSTRCIPLRSSMGIAKLTLAVIPMALKRQFEKH